MRAKATELYAHRINEVSFVTAILKFFIRTVFIHGLESFKSKITEWIQTWTFSWIRYHNSAKVSI